MMSVRKFGLDDFIISVTASMSIGSLFVFGLALVDKIAIELTILVVTLYALGGIWTE